MKKPSRTTFIIEHCLVGATFLALVALSAQHGENPAEGAREWVADQVVWLRIPLKLAMMAALASLLDLLGRYFASAVSGTYDYEAASSRKSAAIRLAVIAVHIVCVAIAMVVAPRTFPCTTVWKGVCIFGAMLVPLAVAFADLSKAKQEV